MPAIDVVIAKEIACSRGAEDGGSTDEKERMPSSFELGVVVDGPSGVLGEGGKGNGNTSAIEDVTSAVTSPGGRSVSSGEITSGFWIPFPRGRDEREDARKKAGS